MLSLDDLSSDWLAPADEEAFSLPAITNFRGVVQCAWDAAGIQNWICAPTGMSTPTALLFHTDGGTVRRFPRAVRYRWKAYEIERQAEGVTSALRIPEGEGGPVVIERHPLRSPHADPPGRRRPAARLALHRLLEHPA
jgi:hypothetical protein